MDEGDETLTDPLTQANLDKLDKLHLTVSFTCNKQNFITIKFISLEELCTSVREAFYSTNL